MFKDEEKSTFKYWFAHWCAYQMTALNLRCWRPKYLLHDMEKPWLMILFNGNYEKVRKWHREHNSHHLSVKSKKYDWLAMVLDWECSRFTKDGAPLTARQMLDKYIEIKKYDNIDEIERNIRPILDKLGI